MIKKSFQLNKDKLDEYNLYLFYGVNEGLKMKKLMNFYWIQMKIINLNMMKKIS